MNSLKTETRMFRQVIRYNAKVKIMFKTCNKEFSLLKPKTKA